MADLEYLAGFPIEGIHHSTLERAAETAVIITQSFITRAMNAPIDNWLYMHLHHCSHSKVLILPSGKIILVHHNNIGYMPPAFRSQ